MSKSEIAIGLGLLLIFVGILRYKESAWLGMGIATGGWISQIANDL